MPVRLCRLALLLAVPVLFGVIVSGVSPMPRKAPAIPQPDPAACNGAAQLCDRRFDQVVFAATHNSMSAAEDGWLFPNQERGIAAQLDDGVRALLIDTHYWTSNDVTPALQRGRSPAALASMRLALSAAPAPQTGPQVCHAACGLGHESLRDALEAIRAFMDRNPDEVLTIFFQDAVSARDTAVAFHQSGLDHYVFTPRDGRPWPTLREMIRAGTRLVVLAENGGDRPAWYRYGWDLVQDTSYHVTSPAAFSCALNRGRPGNSLFLLNNWIARRSPDPADAAIVNSFDALVSRARECEHARGRIPNFIAVDFYGTGDLLSAVDYLNGEGGWPGDAAVKR